MVGIFNPYTGEFYTADSESFKRLLERKPSIWDKIKSKVKSKGE